MRKITDRSGDTTTVYTDRDLIHVKVEDQALAELLAEDVDTRIHANARGVYTVEQAIELRDALNRAIREAQLLEDGES